MSEQDEKFSKEDMAARSAATNRTVGFLVLLVVSIYGGYILYHYM
ncbi:MAG: hypothetical protein AB8D52_02995 [Gammaproteobacteria bacterium]